MLSPGEIAAQLNKLVISPLMIGHNRFEPGYKQKPRIIRHHSCWLIVKGHGVFDINDTHYPAESGKLFFFAPGMKVKREALPDHELEYYFIRFHYTEHYDENEQWVSRPAEESPFPLAGMYTLQNTPQFIYLLEQLVMLWKRRGAISVMRRKLLLQEFWLNLVLDLRAQRNDYSTTTLIERSQDYMATHYQESLSLETLAQMAGLSVSHYSRMFKKIVGYSPIDYLTHLRMDRAKELLVLSDYRLKTIAQSVGYDDEFYFSRMFKKIVGVSPREYAKKHRVPPAGNGR